MYSKIILKKLNETDILDISRTYSKDLLKNYKQILLNSRSRYLSFLISFNFSSQYLKHPKILHKIPLKI